LAFLVFLIGIRVRLARMRFAIELFLLGVETALLTVSDGLLAISEGLFKSGYPLVCVKVLLRSVRHMFTSPVGSE
jgi:hypothetical protein